MSSVSRFKKTPKDSGRLLPAPTAAKQAPLKPIGKTERALQAHFGAELEPVIGKIAERLTEMVNTMGAS